MKMRKILVSRTVRAAAQVCITVALAGCAAAVLVFTPSNAQTSRPDSKPAAAPTSAVPPGYRLEKTVLCYEEHSPPQMGKPGAIKRHEMHVSTLVPQDDCLALDANGWLSVVPGQCSRPPTKTPCEEKP